jgi:hypothetical protein
MDRTMAAPKIRLRASSGQSQKFDSALGTQIPSIPLDRQADNWKIALTTIRERNYLQETKL